MFQPRSCSIFWSVFYVACFSYVSTGEEDDPVEIVHGYRVVYTDTDCQGNNILNGEAVESLFTCLALCTDNCVAVLHNADEGLCWTKSQCSVYESLEGQNIYKQVPIPRIVNGYRLSHTDVDCQGHDIVNGVKVASVSDCTSLCIGNCVAILYNQIDNLCFTKSECSHFKTLEGYNVYHKDIVNGFAHIHHNYRCDGDDIIPQVTVNSLHECMSLCGVDCYAVVFKSAEKSCATKFSCWVQKQEGADVYKKRGKGEYILDQQNTVCTGNNVEANTSLNTMQECISSCSPLEGCVGVAYDQYRGSCWTKSDCSTFQPLTGYNIHKRVYYGYKTIRKSSVCAGNNIGYKAYAYTIDDCMHLCGTDCTSVVYQPEKWFCWPKSECSIFQPSEGFDIFVRGEKRFVLDRQNFDCDGNDLRFFVSVKSRSECLSLCTTDCVAALYNSEEGLCWTKSECSVFQPLTGRHIYRLV